MRGTGLAHWPPPAICSASVYPARRSVRKKWPEWRRRRMRWCVLAEDRCALHMTVSRTRLRLRLMCCPWRSRLLFDQRRRMWRCSPTSWHQLPTADACRWSVVASSTTPPWAQLHFRYSPSASVSKSYSRPMSRYQSRSLPLPGRLCFYLRLFVGLFVSRTMQKLLNRFSQKSVERWYMGHGRNH